MHAAMRSCHAAYHVICHASVARFSFRPEALHAVCNVVCHAVSYAVSHAVFWGPPLSVNHLQSRANGTSAQFASAALQATRKMRYSPVRTQKYALLLSLLYDWTLTLSLPLSSFLSLF